MSFDHSNDFDKSIFFSKQKRGIKQEGGSSIRSIGLGISFLIFFCLFLITPVVVQIQSFQSRDIDLSEFISLSNDTLSTLNQCVRKSLIPMDERIFLGISFTLTIVFVLAALITERNSTKNHPSSTPTNKKVQSKENDSIKTNRRKGSNRRPTSNTELQNQEEYPLIERPPTDGAGQLLDSTNQPPDRASQLRNTTAQPSDGAGQLLDSTNQPPDRASQLRNTTAQPSDGAGQLLDSTDQPPDRASQLRTTTTQASAHPSLSQTTRPSSGKRSMSSI